MKVMLKTIFVFILFLSAISCKNENERIVVQNIGNEWKKKDVRTFDFDVNDAKDQKNIMIVVRNNNEYPYSNLRLIAKIEKDRKNISTDTLNFVLAKPNGEWIGTGFGDTKEILYQYKINYKFPQNGNYSVKVVQAMRNDRLKGIEDIGIKIQNLKP